MIISKGEIRGRKCKKIQKVGKLYLRGILGFHFVIITFLPYSSLFLEALCIMSYFENKYTGGIKNLFSIIHVYDKKIIVSQVKNNRYNKNV